MGKGFAGHGYVGFFGFLRYINAFSHGSTAAMAVASLGRAERTAASMAEGIRPTTIRDSTRTTNSKAQLTRTLHDIEALLTDSAGT